MSKFIVMLDNGTREEQNVITELFNKKAWPQWHWMEDAWLIASVPDYVTAQQLSNEIAEHARIGAKSKLILKIPDDCPMNYWGNAAKEGWNWMSVFWGKAG